jgi:putative transposase
MARLARIVVPGIAHHVTQRGNRRQPVFFGDGDYQAYLTLLTEHARAVSVGIWAWCLMPNHVHLMLTPPNSDALRGCLADAHRRYSSMVNAREGWRGYLWQGRFASFPMDERHMMACARYIELNPVRARLADRPEDWRWSSARAHLTGKADGVTDISALGGPAGDWRAFLDAGVDDGELAVLRSGERTGRPAGDDGFVRALETQTGRALMKRKVGRRPKAACGEADGKLV